MDEAPFRALVESEWQDVPERFARKVENVALLIEDEPSEEVRQQEGLTPGETLLGLYHGVPATERGAMYGVGGTLPDTITLYRLPILAEAQELTDTDTIRLVENVRKVVLETIWHEVGHYFGLEEEPIARREEEGTNSFT